MMITVKGKRKEIKEALFTPQNIEMTEPVLGEPGIKLSPREGSFQSLEWLNCRK